MFVEQIKGCMTKNTLTVETGRTGGQPEHEINKNDQTVTNFIKKDLKILRIFLLSF